MLARFAKLDSDNFLRANFVAVALVAITSAAFAIHVIRLPLGLPFSAGMDALYYFWYSMDILLHGNLPGDWTPLNNAWPILNSLLFAASRIETVTVLVDMQRLTSVVFSTLTVIPVFFICKKFVPEKFALVGVVIFAFEPRLAVNSLLGVTEPLYIFLGATALALFLQQKQKPVLFSFVLASLAMLVRAEGIFFFLALSIMFFVRFRHERRFLASRYLLVLLFFLLIVAPMAAK